MIQADAGLTITVEGTLRFSEGNGFLEAGDGMVPVPVKEIIVIGGIHPVSLAGQRARWTLYVPDIQVEDKE